MSRWVVVISVVLVGVVGSVQALTGSGTQEDPWLIQSLDDFNDFAADANYWDDYTRLETDVNLAGRVYERAVIAWWDEDAFTGVFDGNDHKILNLSIDSVEVFVGLFGRVESGEVKNLAVEGGFVVSGDWSVGLLVGTNHDGVISNCHATGTVIGEGFVGGLCGGNGYGIISNCHTDVVVSGVDDEWYLGGLCGYNYRYGEIKL